MSKNSCEATTSANGAIFANGAAERIQRRHLARLNEHSSGIWRG